MGTVSAPLTPPILNARTYGPTAQYLNDGWNRMDFVCVAFAMLAYIPGMTNFSGLRALRVLRPLKSMRAAGRLKDMKLIVDAVWEAWDHLLSAYALLAGCRRRSVACGRQAICS